MERARAKRRLFVGTYTEGTASEGIYVLAFDEGGRCLHIVNAGTHAPNPSYLVRAQPTGERAGAEAGAQTKLGGNAASTLYAAHELADRSCLAAYEAAEDGTLCCRGTCSSPADAGTCFAAVHPDGRCLYGANYASGSVGLCLLDANGNPCGGLPSVRHAGSGPNRARQSAPHVHSACFVPGTNLLAVVDLGIDTVTLYRAEATGTLETPPVETVRVPPGSGPRMLAFHPHLPLAALVNELANDVLLYQYDRAGTGWRLAGHLALPTAAEGQDAPSTHAASSADGPSEGEAHAQAIAGHPVLAAHPAFSPDGRCLYVSVRGSDRLALFGIDQDGAATPLADCPCGGRGPRHFSLSPEGRHLAVANQDSNEVVMFALDPATGAPREEARIAIPQPSCVIWDG